MIPPRITFGNRNMLHPYHCFIVVGVDVDDDDDDDGIEAAPILSILRVRFDDVVLVMVDNELQLLEESTLIIGLVLIPSIYLSIDQQ
jgi:hypothetical protein